MNSVTGNRRRRAKAVPVCVRVARRRRAYLFLVILFVWCLFLVTKVRGSFTYAKAPATTLHYEQVEIAEGDTLDSIARTYCSQSYDYASFKRDVVRVNQLKSENYIHSGAYLVVPVYE